MYHRLAVLLSLFAVACFATADAQADTYVIDKENSQIAFVWERVGLTRQIGRFNDFSGTLDFEPEAPEASVLDVTVRAASVQTNVAAFDRNLRSPDFFDAASFPVITFKSTAIKRTGDKTGEVTGDLTILGATKPVTLDVTWVFTGAHPFAKMNAAYRDKTVAVFSARGTIKRSEWGLARVLPYVADDITLLIEAEMIKK